MSKRTIEDINIPFEIYSPKPEELDKYCVGLGTSHGIHWLSKEETAILVLLLNVKFQEQAKYLESKKQA